ncbi:DUF4124 domain-containing protein [Thiogranum longum]
MNNPAGKTVFVVLLMAGLSAAHGDLYRWVDEKGQVHFSDQPQGQQSSKLKPLPAPASAQTDQGSRMEKTRKLLNAYEIERQQEREQKAKQKEQEQQRRKNCNQARDDLRQYTDFGNIYRLDDEGNRVYLSEQEKRTLIQRSRAAVAKWCD